MKGLGTNEKMLIENIGNKTTGFLRVVCACSITMFSRHATGYQGIQGRLQQRVHR